MEKNIVERFRENRRKRNERRAAVNEYKWRRVERMLTRFDADGDDDSQNNESKGSKGGGHGNTRLPFGLCQRFGIGIEPGWTPKDAWDALAGKGITADGAYARLKRGEDPGTPDPELEEGTEVTPATPAEPVEPPKEPKKSVEIGGITYGTITPRYRSWDDKTPWQITMTTDDESVPRWSRSKWMRFRSKEDMLAYLKEQGVEETVDPETGEVINPTEVELPESLMASSDGYGYFKALSIGIRGGKFVVFGVDLGGEKVKDREFSTLADAMNYLKGKGIEEDKVKLSPKLKKSEAERKAWMTSGKKEWMEIAGQRCGNLKLYKTWGSWQIEGEDEYGRKLTLDFPTKAEAMAALSDNGVEKVKVHSGYSSEDVDPRGYRPPESKFELDGRKYQKIWFETSYDGKLKLKGKDLDDEVKTLSEQPWTQSYSDYMDFLKMRFGLSPEDPEQSDEVRERIEKMKAEDAEKERLKREFDEKSVEIGARRYVNPTLMVDADGDYDLVGYDRDGRRRHISFCSGPADLLETCENLGVDPSIFSMSDEVKQQIEKHKEMLRGFEEKAVMIGGRKLADIEVGYDGYDYYIRGMDSRGRVRTAVETRRLSRIKDELEQSGVDIDTVKKSTEAEEALNRYARLKEAEASGKYRKYSDDADEVYTGFRAEKGRRAFYIYGTDIEGNEKKLDEVDTLDEVIERLEDKDITDYKIRGANGRDVPRPSYGMHDVYIRKNRDTGGYTVSATSKKFGRDAVMFEGISEQECRDWLTKNNVDPNTVKTRGMNPNDDVKRTHTAKSLANFDKHREKRVETLPTVSRLTKDEKQQTADMLTDLFKGSAYRMRVPSDYVDDIFDTHFKNLLETGHSGGSDYKPGRRETHKMTFGGDYNVRPVDAEKYGYLGYEDDLDAFRARDGGHYGDVTFKFKKDDVGERATYTFGDTLDMGRPLAGYAGDHPTIEGISAVRWPGEDASGIVRDILTAYNDYKRGNMSIDDLRNAIIRKMASSYIECQYHGMLTFDNVESATFSDWGLSSFVKSLSEEKRKKMLNYFRDHGTKIQYVKDGVLHDGLPLFENGGRL